MKTLAFSLPLLLLLPSACNGTTGGEIVTFDAYASGPPGAASPFEFETMRAQVTLTKAMIHIGAAYLTTSVDTGSSAITPCVDPGRYVAQVFNDDEPSCGYAAASTNFDLLDPEPQPFQVLPGNGTADLATTGEVWLTGGDVNAPVDLDFDGVPTSYGTVTPIVEAAGTAVEDGKTIPFTATVTIGPNRLITASCPAQPGLNPICAQRIVSPIPLSPGVEVFQGGALYLTVDPRGWFTNIDFSTIPASGVIPDDNTGAGFVFFTGVESGSEEVFSFSFH
jgi:hypothetical protein